MLPSDYCLSFLRIQHAHTICTARALELDRHAIIVRFGWNPHLHICGLWWEQLAVYDRTVYDGMCSRSDRGKFTIQEYAQHVCTWCYAMVLRNKRVGSSTAWHSIIMKRRRNVRRGDSQSTMTMDNDMAPSTRAHLHDCITSMNLDR